MLLQGYNHILIYATTKQCNTKGMSPKSSIRSNKKNQAKMKKEEAISLNVISRETNKKEADKPVYLLRYDD
jgi:hypothetical protein